MTDLRTYTNEALQEFHNDRLGLLRRAKISEQANPSASARALCTICWEAVRAARDEQWRRIERAHAETEMAGG